MMSMNLTNVAILSIKVSDYCCIISLISKNEAIDVMQNAVLAKKAKYYKAKKKKKILSNIKMGKEI